MEIKDFILVPFYLMVVLSCAIIYKQRFVKIGKKIFIPGLLIKLLSGLIIGLLYKYYYDGGDTYAYFREGKIISQAFFDNPKIALKLLLSNGEFESSTYQYSSQLYYYRYAPEFLVVKIVGVFSILFFDSYSLIALNFALMSFTGLWAMYKAWINIMPSMSKYFGIILFLTPSLVFWGSGILKDTIVVGALGWMFYSIYFLILKPRNIIKNMIILFITMYLVYIIKIYLILSFIPPLAFWLFIEKRHAIKNEKVRRIALPFLVIIGLISTYYLGTTLTEGDEKYALSAIGERAKISADWVYYVSITNGGAAYYLGELDGTINSLIALSPKALFVTLFRPFLWEVRNPLMLLSAIEVLIMTILLLVAIIKRGVFRSIGLVMTNPFLLFCAIFSIILAVGIGLTTYNFGSLARYKIPLLPFYLVVVFSIWKLPKLPRKR